MFGGINVTMSHLNWYEERKSDWAAVITLPFVPRK